MDRLVTEAIQENVNIVINFVDGYISGCTLKIRKQIKIAVDEIFSNIARYAYNNALKSHRTSRCLTVGVAMSGGVITIIFEDNGIKYNPLFVNEPNILLLADERKVGGLGIYMVKNIMDSIEYVRENNKNILTVKKKLR